MKDIYVQSNDSFLKKIYFIFGASAHYILRLFGINYLKISELAIKCSECRFKTRKNTLDFWMVWKDYEKENFDRIISLKPEDYLFVDVGANIGRYSICLAKRGFETYSFEPIKSNYILLNQNIKLNKLKNIKTYNLALGNKVGKEHIYFQDGKHGEGSIIFKEGNKKIEEIKIDKLDNFFDKKLKKYALLKIDVEGFEYEVLMGASKFIRKNRPLILIEIWNQKSIDFLKNNGYFQSGEFWYPVENYHYLFIASS